MIIYLHNMYNTICVSPTDCAQVTAKRITANVNATNRQVLWFKVREITEDEHTREITIKGRYCTSTEYENENPYIPLATNGKQRKFQMKITNDC